MVNIFLFVVMMVIALDTAVEYSLSRSHALRREFDSVLIWRFIAALLIIVAIAK